MVLVEMRVSSEAGLEGLVEALAQGVEGVLEGHGAAWSPEHPLTLREALRMGLRRQMLEGHACPEDAGPGVHRVWVALPEGGLRAWTQDLVQRVLQGCGRQRRGAERLPRALQHSLVNRLGPCLRRAEAASWLPF